MKIRLFTIISVFVLIIAACHSSKKTTSTASAPTPVAVTVPSADPVPAVASSKPADGIYEPGEEELKAVQPRFADLTVAKLKEGYTLYALSACVSCHKAQNIYKYDEMQWAMIIERMAIEAKLTKSQKEAVFKYVVAIKSAKDNQGK